jgi:hypothetical protein
MVLGNNRAIGAMVFANMILWSSVSQSAFFDHEVSEQPARTGSELQMPPTSSEIGAHIAISYQALSDAVTSALPKSFHADGRTSVCADLNEAVQQTIQRRIGGDVGRFLGNVVRIVTQVVTVNQLRHVCQDVDYKVQVDRASPLTVSPASNAARLVTNVFINGQAGFSGDLAKALALNAKNFRGALELSAMMSADLDDHWCPHLSVVPNSRWTNQAELEIVHNVWLGIEGQVSDQVNKQLRDAVARLQENFKCNLVTDAVQRIWHPYSVPLAIGSQNTTATFLNIIPENAGFSGVNYDAADLEIAVTIEAGTQIGPNSLPIPAITQPLPPLRRIPASSDRINISLPITASYEDITKALRSFVEGKSFEKDLPVGHVKVRIAKVDVYPTNGKLVVVIHFAAKTGHQMFDTNGTVYLTGEPTLEPDRQVIKVQNLSVTNVLDNRLWEILSIIFNDQIKVLLQQNAVFDLRPKIAQLRTEIQTEIARAAAQQKIGLTLDQNFVGLRQIALQNKTIVVVVGFQGAADMALNVIELSPPKPNR